jgi:putative heme-binding domain-containing protein
VLEAIESGRISPADLSAAQFNRLRTHADAAISQRAVRLFGPVSRQRPDIARQFLPAARLPGEPSQGRQIFLARCAACHRLGGEGQGLGPDLAGAKAGGKERILDAILEPNRDVALQYAACVVETKDGEDLVGIKTEETDRTLTLRQPNGVAMVWPLASIQSVQTQPWSLMPEGLEQGLELESLADLLEYIMATPR